MSGGEATAMVADDSAVCDGEDIFLLSVERLSSMKIYVLGLGTAQVLVTVAVIHLVAHFISGQLGPAAIVVGNGLALSSTAVVLQGLRPIPPPDKSKEEILLFFKLYDPEKEELRLFVRSMKTGRLLNILSAMMVQYMG